MNEEGADLMGDTILVVDDDREIVGAIAAALEKEGWHVLRAIVCGDDTVRGDVDSRYSL